MSIEGETNRDNTNEDDTNGRELDVLGADAGGDGTVRGVPSDNTTLSSVLTGLASEGFTGQFAAASDGRLECLTCGAASSVNDYTVTALRRLEGASDPSDQLSVLATSCPVCNARGTAILGFGPEASPDDAAVLKSLARPD